MHLVLDNSGGGENGSRQRFPPTMGATLCFAGGLGALAPICMCPAERSLLLVDAMKGKSYGPLKKHKKGSLGVFLTARAARSDPAAFSWNHGSHGNHGNHGKRGGIRGRKPLRLVGKGRFGFVVVRAEPLDHGSASRRRNRLHCINAPEHKGPTGGNGIRFLRV